MQIQLIKGHFNPKEAIELIAELIHVKIKFHETQINDVSFKEDVKTREHRIKKLQKDLYNAGNYIKQLEGNITIESEITITI